jgi:hypothetical protein
MQHTGEMAEPLKNLFGHEIVHRVVHAIEWVHAAFDAADFTAQARERVRRP